MSRASSDRERLLEILARKSFRLGSFQLSSGATSDYYVDCRTTTLDPEGGLLVGRLLLADLHSLEPRIEAVGGLTLGADPIVVSIAVQSALTPPALSAFIVRKSEKAHGTGRRIEGTVRAGARVAIVDDVCTTAGSTIQAIEAAWDAQLEVAAVRCIIEREEAGGRARLNELWRARRGSDCPFRVLFTAGEVRNAYQQQAAKP
jgi:orotate phosphoribosyltransferase